MTATATPNNNGRQQRKNLSSQLDRLDSILDGLDSALAGAITDAVKEAVSVATAEAVRATLIEVVTNPELIALLRGGTSQTIQPEGDVPHSAPPAFTSPTTQQPSVLNRAWRWSIGKLNALRQAVGARLVAARDGITSTYRQARAIWSLKRPMLIAVSVGTVIGMISYASSPWLAGVVSGLVASVAALGVQLAIWARRVFARMPFAH